jgi:anti-sigma regulatory factor (Ser/Thr protein kinase)
VEVASHTVVPVNEASQPAAARFAARGLADRVGFTESDSYRVGLVATELATNLVKHARAGEVLLRAAYADDGPELELLAVDRGPGMANISASLVDGHSTTGSAGIGLGAVRRLSEEFDIHSCIPHGTVVLACLRPRNAAAPCPMPFVVAGVSVIKAGETECGDAWSVERRPDGVLVLVADGLGHGHFAAEAATAAVQTFRQNVGDSCADALAAMHQNLRSTRGAAAALAQIGRSRRLLKFAGVGNICAAVLTDGLMRHAVSHNGTLGHEARLFREYVYPWEPQSLLVMHSDGLSSHWSLDRYPGLSNRHPALIAGVLYRDFKRGHDDVTIVVGREAA